MIRRNKYFMQDLLESVLEYMKEYQCSMFDSISDLDYPITYNEVKKLSEMTGWSFTDEEIQRLGKSDKQVASYESYEQREYNFLMSEE